MGENICCGDEVLFAPGVSDTRALVRVGFGNSSHNWQFWLLSHGAASSSSWWCADSFLPPFPPLIETYQTVGNERGPFLRATVLSHAL